MGSSKAGKDTAETKIDPRLTEASVDALDYGALAARLPYMPNRGTVFAAEAPGQIDARNNNQSAASALGMQASSSEGYMPAPQRDSAGFLGYSPAGVFDRNMDESMSPGMRRSLDLLYADPATGQYYDEQSPLYQPVYGGGKGMNEEQPPPRTGQQSGGSMNSGGSDNGNYGGGGTIGDTAGYGSASTSSSRSGSLGQDDYGGGSGGGSGSK
jgi:hypothetical protein